MTEITPGMIAAGTLAFPVSEYVVTLKDEHGDSLPDAFVSGVHKGQDITYTLTHTSSGNSCWGTMLIEDKIAPTIIGCESGEVTIDNVGCFSYARLDLAMVNLAMDNCDPSPELIILDEYLDEDNCEDNMLKTIIREIKAVDNCGNESEPCIVRVTLERLEFELVDFNDPFPTGFVIPADTIIECGLVNQDLFPENLDFNNNPDPINLSGVPSYYVNSQIQYSLLPIDEMAHCKLNVVYQDSVLVRDACFTKIVRHWTFLEGCLNNPRELSFVQQITIMDLEAPEMTKLPEKLNFSTNSASEDLCAAITAIPIPLLTDNCQDTEDIRLFVTINGQLPQIEYTGQTLEFPDGLSELVYIATDGCFNGLAPVQGLNETRDTVEVWVEDNSPPVCQIDDKAITINNDTGEVKVLAQIFDDGSYDDCSGKVKIFAQRNDDDDNLCPCAPEDAVDRYSDFEFLGRYEGHDYYLSDELIIGPKAFNVAVAMGGYVTILNDSIEQDWLQDQISQIQMTANPPVNAITYTVANADGMGASSQGWNSDANIEFVMGSTANDEIVAYNGLGRVKRFVIEVEEPCGYSETVRFCCLDVFDGAPITVRTMDKWGNFNECDLVVNIQDKIAPLITCPPADTILCSDYTLGMDLTVFGEPTSIDACPAVIMELDEEIDISACKTGTITRNFEIKSGAGSQMCNQVIVVEAIPPEDFDDPIDPKDIYLPRDADLLGLGDEDLTCFEDTSLLNPDNFPAMFVPQFVDNRQCSDLWIGYTDDIFEVPEAGPSTCFKLVRHWTILDDCDMDNPVVLYEYDQSIIITNDIEPTIAFINDQNQQVCNVASENGDCLSENINLRFRIRDECTARADIDVLFFLDLNCDGVFDSTSMIDPNPAVVSLNFSNLPIGNHKVIIEAVDACNNVGTSIFEFSVVNCVAPIAACQALTMPLHCFPDPPTSPLINGGNVSLETVDCDGDGVANEEMYTFMCSQAEWFSPIKGESYHPCGLPVVYSFSTDTTDVERCFTCEDLECPQEVTIYITDEFGNVDSCITTMTLTDPKGLCPAPQVCIMGPDDNTVEIDDMCLNGAPLGALADFGPSVDSNCCDQFTIDFEDEPLPDDGDGCRVIRRTWTVETNCSCPVIEEFTQVFTIRNDEAPQINCPADPGILVPNIDADNNCTVDVNLAAISADNCQTGLQYTSFVVIDGDTIRSGRNFPNTTFPIGTFFVNYEVTNACDLSSTCRTRIRVRDNENPVLDCVSTLSVDLENQMITLDSSVVLDLIFNTAPMDNCMIADIDVNPPSLDCDNLNNPVAVVVTVTDGSNNSTSCTVNITAVDPIVPMVVCPTGSPFTQTAQLPNCTWTADTSLDATVVTNCSSIVSFTITGSTTVNNGSGSSIAGQVLNLGRNVITYTVTDENGNTDTCMIIVNVMDNAVPNITCPDDDVLLLNQNCRVSVPRVLYRRGVEITNSCTSGLSIADLVLSPDSTILTGVGTQVFTITAVTDDLITVTCQFTVTTEDQRAPTVDCPNGDVSATLDFNCRPRVPDLRVATDNCDGDLPELDTNGPGPRVYQQPREGTIWDGISDVLIVAVDASGNRDTCMVSLSAACPGEANAPTFTTNPGNISSDSNNDCEANINVPFAVEYCIPANLTFGFTVDGPNAAAADLSIAVSGVMNMTTNAVISGTMPAGSHIVTLTANDTDCGLSTPISFEVVIIASGGTPPTFRCKKIVKTIQDGPTPSVTFLSDEIVCVEGGLSCDGSNPTIIASFSTDPRDQTRTYVCGDLGDIQVTMFIYDVLDSDGDGDLDTIFREPCFAIQTVIDQNNFCTFFTATESNVEGRIRTEDGTGIENTSVALIGTEDSQEFMTEEHGLYAFPSMPMGGQYTIKPEKEGNTINGLSTLDLILIQKHILGISTFDSPYKMIAADVNQSGSLSALDLLELRKVILALQDGFDTAPTWKMIDAKYQFLDVDNPLVEPYPSDYSIQSLDKNMAIDFVAVKMGDVNLSADPTSLVLAETRTIANTLDLIINPVVDGQYLRYDFTSSNFNDIEGFQFTLDFDPSEMSYQFVRGSVLDITDEHVGFPESHIGHMTVSYDKIGGVSSSEDELLFSIVFKHTGNLNQNVKTSSEVLVSQAYSTTDVFDLTSQMSFSQTDIKLYQNSPNPWQESTEISFSLPVEMDYELRFYTVSGELLHSIKKNGNGGLNNIKLTRDQLATKGLVYYELITATEKTTKRMILIR